jgi:hypothetical protein
VPDGRIWRTVTAVRTVRPFETPAAALEDYADEVLMSAPVCCPERSISVYMQRYDAATGRWLTVAKTERTPPLVDEPPPAAVQPLPKPGRKKA